MLTGKEDEWNEVENINGIPLFENKLYSHVFKYGKDGHAYDDTSFPRRDVNFPYFIKCCNVKETNTNETKGNDFSADGKQDRAGNHRNT